MSHRRDFIKLIMQSTAALPVLTLSANGESLNDSPHIIQLGDGGEWTLVEAPKQLSPEPSFSPLVAPGNSIARNFNAGLELHETGLNIFSQQIYIQKPNLFEKRQDIIIDQKKLRTLILYVRVTEPITFNLTPVEGPLKDKVGLNQLFALAKVTFTMTDRFPGAPGGGLGLITRIRASLEGIATIGFDGSKIALTLNVFNVTNVIADHPLVPAPKLLLGRLDVSPPLLARNQALAKSGLLTTDLTGSCNDSFQAIVNYLVSAFLEEGLRRPLKEFPVPELDKLLDLPLPLFLRNVSIFSDRLGVYVKHTSGPLQPLLGAPPAPQTPQPHLSVGIVRETVEKAVQALLPQTIPVVPEGGWFEIGGTFTLARETNLRLGVPNIVFARLYIEADLTIRFQFRVLGYDIKIDLYFPVRRPSYIQGNFNIIEKDVEHEEDDGQGGKKKYKGFEIRLRPTPQLFNLLEDHVFLWVDYRKVFEDSIRAWLHAHVTPIFSWIPIIGWIIAKGIEEIVSEVMGFVLGGILSLIVSAFLSLLGNIVYQVLKVLGTDLRVYEIKDKLPITDFMLGIKSIGSPRVEPNGDGEIVLDAWFDNTGLPPIEPPLPTPPALPPAPTPVPPHEPNPPTYPDAAFQPALDVSTVTWQAKTTLTYDVTTAFLSTGQTVDSVEIVTWARQSGPDRWQLSILTGPKDQPATSTSICEFDASTLRQIRDDSWTEFTDSSDPANPRVIKVKVQQIFDHTAGTLDITGTISLPDFKSLKTPDKNQHKVIRVPPSVSAVTTSCWLFRLMSLRIQPASVGKVARADVRLGGDPLQIKDWARFVPTEFSVAGTETIQLGAAAVPALRMMAKDETSTASIWLELGPARRIIRSEQVSPQYKTILQLRA